MTAAERGTEPEQPLELDPETMEDLESDGIDVKGGFRTGGCQFEP